MVYVTGDYKHIRPCFIPIFAKFVVPYVFPSLEIGFSTTGQDINCINCWDYSTGLLKSMFEGISGEEIVGLIYQDYSLWLRIAELCSVYQCLPTITSQFNVYDIAVPIYNYGLTKNRTIQDTILAYVNPKLSQLEILQNAQTQLDTIPAVVMKAKKLQRTYIWLIDLELAGVNIIPLKNESSTTNSTYICISMAGIAVVSIDLSSQISIDNNIQWASIQDLSISSNNRVSFTIADNGVFAYGFDASAFKMMCKKLYQFSPSTSCIRQFFMNLPNSEVAIINTNADLLHAIYGRSSDTFRGFISRGVQSYSPNYNIGQAVPARPGHEYYCSYNCTSSAEYVNSIASLVNATGMTILNVDNTLQSIAVEDLDRVMFAGVDSTQISQNDKDVLRGHLGLMRIADSNSGYYSELAKKLNVIGILKDPTLLINKPFSNNLSISIQDNPMKHQVMLGNNYIGSFSAYIIATLIIDLYSISIGKINDLIFRYAEIHPRLIIDNFAINDDMNVLRQKTILNFDKFVSDSMLDGKNDLEIGGNYRFANINRIGSNYPMKELLKSIGKFHGDDKYYGVFYCRDKPGWYKAELKDDSFDLGYFPTDELAAQRVDIELLSRNNLLLLNFIYPSINAVHVALLHTQFLLRPEKKFEWLTKGVTPTKVLMNLDYCSSKYPTATTIRTALSTAANFTRYVERVLDDVHIIPKMFQLPPVKIQVQGKVTDLKTFEWVQNVLFVNERRKKNKANDPLISPSMEKILKEVVVVVQSRGLLPQSEALSSASTTTNSTASSTTIVPLSITPETIGAFWIENGRLRKYTNLDPDWFYSRIVAQGGDLEFKNNRPYITKYPYEQFAHKPLLIDYQSPNNEDRRCFDWSVNNVLKNTDKANWSYASHLANFCELTTVEENIPEINITDLLQFWRTIYSETGNQIIINNGFAGELNIELQKKRLCVRKFMLRNFLYKDFLDDFIKNESAKIAQAIDTPDDFAKNIMKTYNIVNFVKKNIGNHKTADINNEYFTRDQLPADYCTVDWVFHSYFQQPECTVSGIVMSTYVSDHIFSIERWDMSVPHRQMNCCLIIKGLNHYPQMTRFKLLLSVLFAIDAETEKKSNDVPIFNYTVTQIQAIKEELIVAAINGVQGKITMVNKFTNIDNFIPNNDNVSSNINP